jgi:L-iditol 2-dehydrogenase
MKAAFFYAPFDIRIEETDKPNLGKDDVLIRVKSASICGTDVQIFKGEPLDNTPIVLGHDFSGIIEALGTEVQNLSAGCRVSVQPVGYCGKCHYCLNGHQNLCREGQWIGFERNGGFSEYASLKEQNVLHLPDSISFDEAAIIEPVALGLRTLDILRPHIEAVVAIIGQGPIGLVQTQMFKLVGANVIGIDIDNERLQLAKKFGANNILNPARSSSTRSDVFDLTSGEGANVVVEASGTQAGIDLASEIVMAGGKIAQVGHGRNLRGPLISLEKELTIQYVELGPLEYRRALKLVEECKVDVKSLITQRITLEDVPEYFSRIANSKITAVKVIVRP